MSFASKFFLRAFIFTWFISNFTFRCSIWIRYFSIKWTFSFILFNSFINIYLYFFSYFFSKFFKIFITFRFILFIWFFMMDIFINDILNFYFLLLNWWTVMSFCTQLLTILGLAFHHRCKWYADELTICKCFIFADGKWFDICIFFRIFLSLQHFPHISVSFIVICIDSSCFYRIGDFKIFN
jgi:hypothetical protein